MVAHLYLYVSRPGRDWLGHLLGRKWPDTSYFATSQMSAETAFKANSRSVSQPRGRLDDLGDRDRHVEEENPAG